MATKRVRLPSPAPGEGSASTPLTIEPPPSQPFLQTREHARFVEFAEACSHYRYIGVCHGRPGVGKTRSASQFAAAPDLSGYGVCSALSPKLADEVAACKAVFYTAYVSNTPRTLDSGLGTPLIKLGAARLTLALGSTDEFDYQATRRACPLVIVDEADRLSIKSLEHLRHMSDDHGFGLVLMGMPGLEKRLARYAQLYSRIGFVHEFKALSEAEVRMLLAKHAADFGVVFDQGKPRRRRSAGGRHPHHAGQLPAHGTPVCADAAHHDGQRDQHRHRRRRGRPRLPRYRCRQLTTNAIRTPPFTATIYTRSPAVPRAAV